MSVVPTPVLVLVRRAASTGRGPCGLGIAPASMDAELARERDCVREGYRWAMDDGGVVP